MPISVSVQNVQASEQVVVITGKLIASGNYSTGGDTVDFTAAIQDPAFVGMGDIVPPASLPPINFSVYSQNGQLLHQYVGVIGTTQKNGKLKVSAVGTFGSELAAGAYPASVTGDNIGFTATFAKLI